MGLFDRREREAVFRVRYDFSTLGDGCSEIFLST